ncbi:AraC family transcriptional regulator [Rhizobium sp. YTUHZ045]|uniref:AraC family transcriptional regulator n=1 Tax=Rhizobium sp. YTUHZ045 TaxID=2962888 RepID=UPI003DA817DE
MNMSRSSMNHSDPLSDVLTTLGARSGGRTRLEASGDWSLSFAEKERLKLVAVLRGKCWILLPDHPPQQLTEGDVFLIGGGAYGVASNPDLTPIDGAALYAQSGRDIVRLGGDETVLIGGSITFASAEANFVLDALPRFLRIGGASGAATAVSRTLELLDGEVGRDRIGGSLVTTRLAEVLFVEAIRAYVAEQGDACIGWIGALADRHIGEALRVIHGETKRPWTVASLAARVGMSRSAFSARFARRVGKPPLEYLTDWRMLLARQWLSEPEADIARIASEVGYLSQSAFGHAFKRTFGHTPRSQGR